MFTEETFEVTSSDGTQFEVKVQRVDMDRSEAVVWFNMGVEVGAFGWKHKYWIVEEDILSDVVAAARFFYGWAPGSEKFERVTVHGEQLVRYEAYYAC